MEDNCNILTIKDYLANIVNFDIPSEALDAILAKRGVYGEVPFADLELRDTELCTADLYIWICTSPTKYGGVSDSDNGWSHKDSGYTLSSADKKRLIGLANDIYDKYGESKVLSSSFRISNHGIKHRNYPATSHCHVKVKG